MQMPGRTINGAGMRYGLNGQENSNEIAGTGNHYTAEFWEYDTRLGRRWNLDPKPTIGISQYSTFNGNPIWFNDLHGDSVGPIANRIWGGLRAVGGVMEMAVGGAGGTATSWTGVGAVLGGAAVVHGADVASAGFTQLITGEEATTFTQRGISKGLQFTGVSKTTSDAAAGYADASLSIILSAGAVMAKDGTFAALQRPIMQVAKSQSFVKQLPNGFKDVEQFNQVGSELKIALEQSGIQFSNIGVRGSAVTNVSGKGGTFRQTAIGTLKASDIDVYVELTQDIGLKVSKNIEGFIHPSRLLDKYPALQNWSQKWSQILGREITPGAFNPGTFKDASSIKF